MSFDLENIYVYATIIDKNDDIPSAIVLSHSIKTNGTVYKIILKISKDIDNIILLNFFDKIIYTEESFKIYEKVLLINVNSVVNKNLDYLFNIDNIKNSNINKNIIKYEQRPYEYGGILTIEDRIENDKYILWYHYYREIVNNNFDLLNNIILKDTNEILKFFISKLSLNIKKKLNDNRNKNDKYYNLNLLYNVKIVNNFEYYYTNVSKEYNETLINFYTNNISIKDFIIFINNTLKTKYDEKKYKNIKKFIKVCNNKEIVLDLYLKYSPSILIILINNEEIINKDIEKNIIYKKNITLKNNELKNILFNINQDFVYDERVLYLDKNYKEDNYKITLLCFEMKDFINFKDTYNIIICEDIDKKLRASGLLLKNYNKKYDFINNYKNIKDTLIIQSLKKWIYNNFNGEEIMNISIFIKKDKFIIVDNNEYTNFIYKIKELNRIKLYFMILVFVKSSSYKTIIDKNKIYINYEITDFFEIDGLKFSFIN
jgi:hypothetical protein